MSKKRKKKYKDKKELGLGNAKWFGLMLGENNSVRTDMPHIIEERSLPEKWYPEGRLQFLWIRCSRCDSVWKEPAGLEHTSFSYKRDCWVVRCPDCNKVMDLTQPQVEVDVRDSYDEEPDKKTYSFDKMTAFTKGYGGTTYRQTYTHHRVKRRSR